MKVFWDGKLNTQDGGEAWERRLWWYLYLSLVIGVGIVFGKSFVMTRSSALSNAIFQEAALSPVRPTTLLTDKASYRPEEVHFSWLPMPHAPGVAACDLVMAGFDMLAFNDKAAANACLRNKSIVLIGDSVTR